MFPINILDLPHREVYFSNDLVPGMLPLTALSVISCFKFQISMNFDVNV